MSIATLSVAEVGIGAKVAAESLSPTEYYKAGVTHLSEFREVWLNGDRLALAVEANVSQGWVRVFSTTDSGMIRHGAFGEPLYEVLYGDVAIRLMHPVWLASFSKERSPRKWVAHSIN